MGYEPPYNDPSTGGGNEQPAPSYGSGEPLPPPPQTPFQQYPPYPSGPQYPPPPAPPAPPSGYGQPMQSGYGQPAAPSGYGQLAQPGYMPPPPGYPMPYVMGVPDTNGGFATASLVLGIISVVAMFFFLCGGQYLALITGILGTIFGIFGLKSVQRHGSAIAGLIMSIIGIVIPLGIIALEIIYYASTYAFD